MDPSKSPWNRAFPVVSVAVWEGRGAAVGRTLNWFSMQLYNWSPRHHLLSYSTRIEAVLCLLVVVSCALLVGCFREVKNNY